MTEKKYSEKGSENAKTKKSEKSEKENCLSSALMIIRSGENTERMIREKLIRKGYSKEAIEYSFEKIKAVSLTDDKRLLYSYVKTLGEKKLYGPLRIKLEVLKKFDKDIISDYFEDALSEVDFFEAAKRLYEKNSTKDRDFIIRKLARCGFLRDHIKYALNSIQKD